MQSIDSLETRFDARRESACPVHFLWDGMGAGRWAVRLGFMGMLVASIALTGAMTYHLEGVRTASGVIGAASAALWVAGQGLTKLVRKPRR